MPAWLIPAIISGVSALGGLLGNKKQQQQTQQTGKTDLTTDTSGTQSIDTSQMPTFDPFGQAVRENTYNNILRRLGETIDFGGYQAEGVGNINKAANTRSQVLQNILSSRGLSYSPLAAAVRTGTESSRISDIANFENQIPLLRNQLDLQNVDQLMKFLQLQPTGSRTTGTTSTTGTSRQFGTTGQAGQVTQSGNPSGGLFGGLGSSLGLLYGLGAFGGRPKTKNLGDISYTP